RRPLALEIAWLPHERRPPPDLHRDARPDGVERADCELAVGGDARGRSSSRAHVHGAPAVQLPLDVVHDVHARDLLTDARVLLASDTARERDEVRRELGRTARAGRDQRAAAAALERKHRLRDGPSVVHFADDFAVIDLDVVEELLAELDVTVDLLDRSHG